MSIPAIPQNQYTQQANGQVFLQWDLVAGATTYSVQRSTDAVNYTVIATPSVPNYLDIAVTLGTQYFYQIASTSLDGTSGYTSPQSVVPTPTGELSLGELRTRSQQRADRLNSQFVTLPEWNFFINQAMFELYDLLVTTYQDMYVAPSATFATNGSQSLYPLPDGIVSFQDDAGNSFVANPFYKLIGVDLAVQTSQNAFVTVPEFNFIDRNAYLYPNSASTIYGVFNMRYRLLGISSIQFIPIPSGLQKIRLWYVPRLKQLLQDTDITNTGISGWLQYVIARAAKYALDKEESDTSTLTEEILFLKQRIEETAANRNAGQPSTISDIRGVMSPFGGANGYNNGFHGGW